jgi:8-oxo-dGTP diphosphatase
MKRVTAAIIIEKRRVFLAQRPAGDPLAGKWEFPGGTIESGETPEQCLARELYEEFGINATIKRFFCESRYSYPKGAIRLLAYLVSDCIGEFELHAHGALTWAAPETLMEYDLAPADIPIAREVGRWLTGDT